MVSTFARSFPLKIHPSAHSFQADFFSILYSLPPTPLALRALLQPNIMSVGIVSVPTVQTFHIINPLAVTSSPLISSTVVSLVIFVYVAGRSRLGGFLPPCSRYSYNCDWLHNGLLGRIFLCRFYFNPHKMPAPVPFQHLAQALLYLFHMSFLQKEEIVTGGASFETDAFDGGT